MGVLAGGGLEGVDDHSLDGGVADRTLGAGARGVAQALQPVKGEAVPPLGHRRLVHVLVLGDLGVGTALCTKKHDARPERQRLG